jgi:hypothetical protein
LNPPHCVIHEFLGASLFRQLVAHIVERQGLFKSGSRYGEGWRVLEEFGSLRSPLVDGLLDAWPDVAPACGATSVDPGDVEVCVKSLGNSSVTRDHHPSAGNHELGFVLFMHREPRPFEGGALHLRGSAGEATIEPAQNSIIFFAASVAARVGPVQAASAALIDSRLTLEGRIHAPACRFGAAESDTTTADL